MLHSLEFLLKCSPLAHFSPTGRRFGEAEASSRDFWGAGVDRGLAGDEHRERARAGVVVKGKEAGKSSQRKKCTDIPHVINRPDCRSQVRWADIEEQRAQMKMREVGFVVGQTNWNRMMDPTDGQSALTQTKIIPSRFDYT